MNKVILMGRLTKDVDLRYTSQSNVAVGRFTVAVERRVKPGEDKQADFISCKAFGKTAENIATYFKKGHRILLTGNLQTGSYEKEGQKHFTCDVLVENFEFVESAESKKAIEPETAPSGFAALEEDIPF